MEVQNCGVLNDVWLCRWRKMWYISLDLFVIKSGMAGRQTMTR